MTSTSASDSLRADALLLLKEGRDQKDIADDASGKDLLFSALSCSCTEAIEMLLNSGVSPDVADKDDIDAVSAAVHSRSVRGLELLLEAKANPNGNSLRGESGMTPLILACRKKFIPAVSLLLRHGADPDFELNGNITAVAICAAEGFPLALRMLVAKGAAVTRSVAAVSGRVTPLALTGDPECAQILIDAKADVTSGHVAGHAPIHRAAGSCSLKMIRILIEAGAPLNTPATEAHVVPLHIAASFKFVKGGRLLLDAKADPNKLDFRGSTPLCVAVGEDWPIDGIREFIRAGADPNLSADGAPVPLHVAKSAACIRLLTEKGADPNKRGPGRKAPIHLAEQADLVSALIEAKADVNARDVMGATPLHLICAKSAVFPDGSPDKKRLSEVAQVLVRHGAQCDAQDNLGMSPLAICALSQNTDLISTMAATMIVQAMQPASGTG